MQFEKDTLFAQPYEALGAFQFDESVASVFPDMIQRSVPGYQTILTGIGELTQQFAQPNSQLYDLGCSLGAVTLTMRRKLPHPHCKIIAVDNAQPMIERAQSYVSAFHSDIEVELRCEDMLQTPIENASVVVMNFTLQFIAPEKRQQILEKIYQGLNPGGILILSEKIHFVDPAIQNAIEALHLQFKRANGYSELEISQKRASLENVLISDSEAVHLDRLKKVGFNSAATWFQAYNFASFLAIKA
ncbi:carboxy-S-adenosyl-L-methionine synthase CmoA [Galenea microaerophila]